MKEVKEVKIVEQMHPHHVIRGNPQEVMTAIARWHEDGRLLDITEARTLDDGTALVVCSTKTPVPVEKKAPATTKHREDRDVATTAIFTVIFSVGAVGVGILSWLTYSLVAWIFAHFAFFTACIGVSAGVVLLALMMLFFSRGRGVSHCPGCPQ